MSMQGYSARPTRWEIGRPGDDVDTRTRVYIEDEGAGAYVEIAQGCETVRIDPEEWCVVRSTIERAMAMIAEHEREREDTQCP